MVALTLSDDDHEPELMSEFGRSSSWEGERTRFGSMSPEWFYEVPCTVKRSHFSISFEKEKWYNGGCVYKRSSFWPTWQSRASPRPPQNKGLPIAEGSEPTQTNKQTKHIGTEMRGRKRINNRVKKTMHATKVNGTRDYFRLSWTARCSPFSFFFFRIILFISMLPWLCPSHCSNNLYKSLVCCINLLPLAVRLSVLHAI